MAGQMDASINMLYPVDEGSTFAINNIAAGKPLDVLADVAIGKQINNFVQKYSLRVALVNVTQSTTIDVEQQDGPLTPADAPHTDVLRVSFAGGWTANPGDVFRVVASYRVNAGVNSDLSVDTSDLFVVA